MELKESIQERRSIRNYSTKRVPIDLIKEIIKYAHLAPSAGNLQAREFIVVDDEKQKLRLSKASNNQMFIAEAPINIVICANLNRISPYGSRGRELYCIQDTAAAVEHILLLAVDYELGACWIGAFNEDEVANILKTPKFIRPVAIIPIGYPKGKSESTSRIDIKHITHSNKW